MCSQAQLDVFHDFLLQMQARPRSCCSRGLEGTDEQRARSGRNQGALLAADDERAHFSHSAHNIQGRISDIDSRYRQITASGLLHMLSGNVSPRLRATNDEGRLVSLGGLASALLRTTRRPPSGYLPAPSARDRQNPGKYRGLSGFLARTSTRLRLVAAWCVIDSDEATLN